jgi:hypothetical protein
MARLVIICPKTLKEFDTGVGGDPESLESGSYENNQTQCPYCGEMHAWSSEHTRVVDD